MIFSYQRREEERKDYFTLSLALRAASGLRCSCKLVAQAGGQDNKSEIKVVKPGRSKLRFVLPSFLSGASPASPSLPEMMISFLPREPSWRACLPRGHQVLGREFLWPISLRSK